MTKKPRWTWMQVNDDRWVTAEPPEDEAHPARIQRSARNADGTHTFFCYRNGRFVDGVSSLDDAKAACVRGERDEDREASAERVREYMNNHAGEIPPFLALTKEERGALRKSFPSFAPSEAKVAAAGSAAAVKKAGRSTGGRGTVDSVGVVTGRVAAADPPQAQPPKAGAAGRAARTAIAGVIRPVAGAVPLGKAGTKWHERQAAVLAAAGQTVQEQGDRDAVKHMLAKGQITLEEK